MDSSETLSRAIENPNLKQSVRFGIVLEAGGQDGALLPTPPCPQPLLCPPLSPVLAEEYQHMFTPLYLFLLL